MTATSVFKGLAPAGDRDLGRARTFDTQRDRRDERILYRSDFDTGLDNWIDHWNGFQPWPVIGRTNRAAVTGSHSLMLATSEGTYDAASAANYVTAFRRIVRTRPDSAGSTLDTDRFSSVSAWLAVGNGGLSTTGAPWQQWEMMIDTNAYDNSSRSLYRVLCKTQAGPNFTRFRIRDNSGADVAITGSDHVWQGDNDNKQSFGYVRLTVDRKANGGKGGYYELQVNTQVFDLTGLGAGWADTAIQGGGTVALQEFNGGDNIGFAISRSTVDGGCQLFVDDVTYSTRDAA